MRYIENSGFMENTVEIVANIENTEHIENAFNVKKTENNQNL